jgi:hypothetical protein
MLIYWTVEDLIDALRRGGGARSPLPPERKPAQRG